MKFTTVYSNPKKFTTVQFTSTRFRATVMTPGVNTNVGIILASLLTSPQFIIYWGDGNISRASTSLETQVLYSHIYSTAGTYSVEILNAQSITQFNLASDGIYHYWDFNCSQLSSCCPDLSLLSLTHVDGNYHGGLTGCNKLTHLDLYGANTITFDITNMVELNYFRSSLTNNVASGSINGLTKMVTFYPSGASILSGNPVNMPLLESFECNEPHQNTISGSLSNLQHLKVICWRGNGTLTCDVSTLPVIEYLSADSSITFTGSITGKTSLWYISVSGLSGTINALTNLVIFANNSHATMDQQYRFNNHTVLDYLYLEYWNYTNAQTNQILADLWGNRNVARSINDLGYRAIFIYGGKPTGQGLLDMVSLMNYKSPNGIGPKAWDVTTGLTIGAEIIENSTFAASTGWTLGVGHTISGGKFRIDCDDKYSNQWPVLVSGHNYLLKIVTDSINVGGILRVYVGTENEDITEAGTHYVLIAYAGGDSHLYIQNPNIVNAVLSEVSLKELT